ncbi:MAG: hypothetical protein U0359_19110 [Byssovorax sp.]
MASTKTKKKTNSPAPTPTNPVPVPMPVSIPSKDRILAPKISLSVLEGTGPTELGGEGDIIPIAPPTWFFVTLKETVSTRYAFLLQKETGTGYVVLLGLVDRRESASGRLPPAGGYQRAVVDGTVHVLVSDDPLTREEIVAFIGGHEPPTKKAVPPYT